MSSPYQPSEACTSARRADAGRNWCAIGATIAEILTDAVAVALINPIPVVAVILLLLSSGGRSTAFGFVAGWVIGLSAVLALLLFVVPFETIAGNDREPSTFASIVKLLLGLALLFLALRKWQSRSDPGKQESLPSWMATIASASAIEALGFGVVLSGLNPKNLVFTLAAALAIAEAELTRGNELIALVVFVLVASIGVGMPVLWHAVARESATRTLTEWKGLLTANYATIMAVVFLVFGVKLFGQGLGDLIG